MINYNWIFLQGPFCQSGVNPNLIAIVPSVLPPQKIDSNKLPTDVTLNSLDEGGKTLHNSQEVVQKKNIKLDIIEHKKENTHFRDSV